MTTCADWKAELARNPRDPSLWEIVADWLLDGNEWVCPACAIQCSDFTCHCKCHANTLTAHLARLTAWRLRMEDERWHGVEPCNAWCHDDGNDELCRSCNGERKSYPTFALLFDREGEECDGRGHRIIPGHVSELAAYLESQGDGRAAKVREIRVERASVAGGWEGWKVLPAPRGVGSFFTATYADACREAVRRVVAVFTEECPSIDSRVPGMRECVNGCPQCFGLDWVATSP